MNEIYVSEVSKRAENWKRNHMPKQQNAYGRIMLNSIIALTLTVCVMLVAFVNTPITNNIRTGLKNAVSADLNLKDTLGNVFYVDDGTKSTAVNGNATIDSLLYMPAIGKAENINENGEKGISITCGQYVGAYAAASGTIENIMNPTDGKTVILLRHNDNMLSIYTGCGQLFVKKGDKVVKKQLLSSIAQSENGFVLKYQLQKNEEIVDPMEYIEYEGTSQ